MIKEQIDGLLLELAKDVNEAILEGDFKKLQVREHTITIECCGEVLEVWNDNAPIHTACYRMGLSDNRGIDFPKHVFREHDRCREMLRLETGEEKTKRISDIDNEIKRLQEARGE